MPDSEDGASKMLVLFQFVAAPLGAILLGMAAAELVDAVTHARNPLGSVALLSPFGFCTRVRNPSRISPGLSLRRNCYVDDSRYSSAGPDCG